MGEDQSDEPACGRGRSGPAARQHSHNRAAQTKPSPSAPPAQTSDGTSPWPRRARLTNGEVTFLTPTLAAGDYWLEARRLYGGNKDLLRVGRLGFKLTVA